MITKYRAITGVMYEIYLNHYAMIAIGTRDTYDFDNFLPRACREDEFVRTCCLTAATLGLSHSVRKIRLATDREVPLEVMRLLTRIKGGLDEMLPVQEDEEYAPMIDEDQT